MDFWLKWKIVRPGAMIPVRAYSSAGYDLWPAEDGVIPAGEMALIPLGIASAFHEGYVAVIDDRGSVGKRGITHLAGVIDADYRGEWVLMMANLGHHEYSYSRVLAIAQALFLPLADGVVEVVEELPESGRGVGKLGSSGH